MLEQDEAVVVVIEEVDELDFAEFEGDANDGEVDNDKLGLLILLRSL